VKDPMVAARHVKKIDWALAIGCGLGAGFAFAIENTSLALWLGAGSAVSALAAYLEPARRIAQHIQRKHMRSAR